jgi:hypothetical protein
LVLPPPVDLSPVDELLFCCDLISPAPVSYFLEIARIIGIIRTHISGG